MSNATQPDPIQLKRPDPDACSPQKSPAWRWCTAMYVSDPNCGNPPNSDDPWVQDAAEFLRQCRTGWSEGSIEPTETQRVIREAVALYGNKVQRAILEARLLANETCDDIVRHSGILASVVEAYEQLFFNVANQICLKQVCGNLFRPERVLQGLLPDRDIGFHLQMVARTEGTEGVEATAELLARLDGKTFAEGLPAEFEVGRRWERMSRLGLIRGLGLFKPKQQKHIQTLVGNSPSMMIAMQTATDKTLPLWDELLSQVQVPKDIREYANGLKKATAQAGWPCKSFRLQVQSASL
ncbi:MAG: hypothetical protein NTY19_08325 [Planctomycetota bacterium]|nr:hypothetical protein [Planctomycetota bacterium]